MSRGPLVLVAAALIAGCGSDSTQTAQPAPPHRPLLRQPGCTQAPDCGTCETCEATCQCNAVAVDLCAATCRGPEDASSPPPPIPSEPLVLRMDTFDVEPGEEVFMCQSFTNPMRRDVDVLVSESIMTPGSHHLFAFQMPRTFDGPLERCGGLEFHPSIHGAQVPHETTTYPPGVGRFLPGDSGIRILVHYLNTTTAVIHVDVELRLTLADPANVPMQASGIFMNIYALSIAPHSRQSATGSCLVHNDIEIISASSHMHQRGVHFEAKTNDGTLLYRTDEWSEPVPAKFDPPLHVKGGSTVTWTCDYDNQTDMTLTFGESALTNEMCIFTGAYYPAPDGKGVECLF